MSKSKEKWKDVPGYEKYYEASTFGRVNQKIDILYAFWNRGIRKKLYKKGIIDPLFLPSCGYFNICLRTEDKREVFKLHIVILTTFAGPCPEGMECRHLDDNKANNKKSNLKWGTHNQNVADQYRNKIRQASGESNPHCKITFKEVKKLRKIFASEINQYPNKSQLARELASAYKVHYTTILSIVENKERLVG